METPANRPPEIPKDASRSEQIKPQTTPAEVQAFMERNTALFVSQLETARAELKKLQEKDPEALEVTWTKERIKELTMILKNRGYQGN